MSDNPPEHPRSAVEAGTAPPRRTASPNPEPFASRMAGRTKRPLGDLFGLRNFGVDLTTLAPGAVSALHHRQSRQDEFIYVLAGEPTLFTDAGEERLRPGICAGFPAGGTAHHLANHTSEPVVLLEVGDRAPDDEVKYLEDDLQAVLGPGIRSGTSPPRWRRDQQRSAGNERERQVMHALIVHVHPEPCSFSGALTTTSRTVLEQLGYSVQLSDLYADEFDPREGPVHYRKRADPRVFSSLAEQRHAWETATLPEDVAREVARLQWADLVVFQFPLWWHGPPAMLKGWMDRVFVNGGLYTSSMRYDRGYFRGKRAICSVTTGAPGSAFGPGSRGGDMDCLLWPLYYSLHYMGFSVLRPFLAHGVQGHGYAYQDEDGYRRTLEGYEADWARRLKSLDGEEPLSFPGWSDWDGDGRNKAQAPEPIEWRPSGAK